MELKKIVEELCSLKDIKRTDFIINYLRQNNIEFNILNYSCGINIEIVKKGLHSREFIFFAHHDIYSSLTEGANDNTSSVAVLLSLCKYLYFQNPDHSIRVVFNDREELLGGLLNKSIPREKLEIILENTGSYQYLKNYVYDKSDVAGIFILELSGIGDSLYFATRSGSVECDKSCNSFFRNIADRYKFKYIEMPVLNSDMISLKALGFEGALIGATPYNDSKTFLQNSHGNNAANDYPYIWKKIHTSMDNYFSIQESALDMVYNFLIRIVENLDSFSSEKK